MRVLVEKMGKRALLCVIALGVGLSSATAQVKGISYTLSPTGEYVFWNQNTGISDGFLVGGHLGFGFGEFVELRATYLQDLNNLNRDFTGLTAKGLQNLKLDTIGVGVQRWGGDLKLNLSRGGLVPYITVGTGVQTISPDSLVKYKNIYVSGGAGLQFSAGDRYTLNVQAVNTTFNDSPLRSLTSAAERTANALALADYPTELLKNWSVRASLILYLGGRRPGELTEIDKAYLNNFSSGLSLPIEITGGQLNFGKTLPYADTKYIGVSSGFNFGPYVGIRGFYWRGMDEGYFSSVNRLAVYGGEGKFKLSNGQGLTPAISLGGGVIDALQGYQVDGQDTELSNKPFVSGGLGLDFPFSRALKLTAYAKALLTSNDSLQNTVNPSELTTSWAYGLSLNLLIGNGAKDVETEKESSYDELVMNNLKREQSRAEDMKEDYQNRIDRLDDELRDSRRSGDRRMVRNLQEEQDDLQQRLEQIEEIQKKEQEANKDAYKNKDALLINMKPTEYRSMLNDIDRSGDFNRRNGRSNYSSYESDNRNASQLDALEDRLKSIEQKLDDLQSSNRTFRNYPSDSRDENRDSRQNRDRDNYDQRDRSNGARNDRQGNRNRNDYESNQNNDSDLTPTDDYRRNMNGNRGSRNEGAAQENDTDGTMSALKAERQKSEDLRQAYEERIDELEEEIKQARDRGDDRMESDKKKEKESIEKGARRIREAQDKENRANRRAYRENNPSLMTMDSSEFKAMVEEVEKENEEYREGIEKSLQKYQRKSEKEMENIRNDRTTYRQGLEGEIDDLKKEIADLKASKRESARNGRVARAQDMEKSENENFAEDSNASNGKASSAPASTYRTEEQVAYKSENLAKEGFFSLLNYDGTSAFAGFNFGGATTINIGFRNHFRYKTTNLYLMPEAFFGFGVSSAYGLFANGVYDIKLKNLSDFSPYAGAGLGLMKVGDSERNNTKAAFNIILGANLFKVANGRFYVDYSIRNFFKYNQLSAGYRLPF